MQKRTLHDGWSFRPLGLSPDYHQPQLQHPGWSEAQVPGFVHLDLLREGVIADPFYRRQETSAQWVDETDWSYRTRFSWSATEGLSRRILRFEGLDTVCEIFLNDAKIGASDNMFVPLEIDVTDLLQAENELRVDFHSAIKVGQERRRAYFEANDIAWDTQWFDERAFVRKAQYMSGWDWGPRLVSCGIWGQVELLEFTGRIVEVSFLQERLDSGRFRVWAEAVTEGEGELSFEVAGQSFGLGQSIELEPDLWWPAGEGPQTLLPARAIFGGHVVEKRIGLRTIRLLREKDEFGRSFEFEVNGRKIYARGANWIPDDSFVTRADVGRIKDFPKLGFNMLRVWGGGFYESEAFYDACDEAGILVWQDFPYACSYYPDSDAEVALAEAEASVQVKRLRDRASLALWCGNNENEVLWIGKWGGVEKAPARYYGERLYNEALPTAVDTLANGTPYIRTSPIGFEVEAPELTDRAERFGDSHYWDVWHGRGDWKFYDESETRFSSEYGFASAPSDDVWKATLASSDWRPDSPVVWWHDKTGKGQTTFRGYTELHYKPAETLQEWTYTSQLNQRDAMRHGVEHFRRSPYCRGSLIWQINDCWPVQSWALEDYHRLLKPAGQEMARVYAPTMVSVVLRDSLAEVWLVHDGPVPEVGRLLIAAVDTRTGDACALGAYEFVLNPGERRLIQSVGISDFETTRTALRAGIDGRPETTRWAYLCEPKDLQLGTPSLSAQVEADCLWVTVKGFVADMVVWDEHNPRAVLGPWSGLAGRTAVTVANGTIGFPLSSPLTQLRARSLSGEHPL